MRTFDHRPSRIVAAGVAVLGLIAVAVACSQDGGGGSSAADPAATATPAPSSTAAPGASTPIACAVNGALTWSDSCTVERALVNGAPVLVVRHADGSFRRFDVLAGGTLAEADGAVRAAVIVNGTTLEVTLGSDRYRLATSLLGNAP